jgi:lambda family phage portal protein
MREFRMATHWTRTELQSQIANSLIAAFLKTSLSQEQAAEMFSSGDDAGTYWKSAVEEWRPMLKGGAIIPLPPGAEVQSHIPGRPNNAFESFLINVLRNISAAFNIPYELLAKDFSRTNYSSARAALLEAWRYFLGRRRWLMDYWLNPILDLWLEEAVNAGRIQAPGFYENRYAYSRARWVFAGRGWVDPSKEADGQSKRMENNTTTLEHECAEQGLDWEEVIEQRAAEVQMMDALGVPHKQPSESASAAAESSATPPGEERDETEDGEDPGRLAA